MSIWFILDEHFLKIITIIAENELENYPGDHS
jgi:hypothetical protein